MQHKVIQPSLGKTLKQFSFQILFDKQTSKQRYTCSNMCEVHQAISDLLYLKITGDESQVTNVHDTPCFIIFNCKF